MWRSNNPAVDDLSARTRRFGRLIRAHIKAHWLAWLLLCGLYALFHANYRIGINLTPSLPFRLFLIHWNAPAKNGDYIAFRWHGGEPYPDGIIFTKRLLAGEGDRVLRSGRDFYVNGTFSGTAREYGITGRKLEPADVPEGESLVPRDSYYVAGTHEYSLDSRYKLLGYVRKEDVVGRAYPIF